VEEVEPEGLPRNLTEALALDQAQPMLQYRTVGGVGPGGRHGAMVHGHGGVAESEKGNLLRYFRQVDEALVEYLGGRGTPLVLAGVEHYFPIYREASRLPTLAPEGVKGSPDALDAKDLHARAWAIVEPLFARAREDAVARYRAGAGTGRTSADVEEIVRAAHHGRVEVLFAARGHQRWGAWIPDGEGSAILHERYERGDQDLLDLSAAETLRRGGRVFAVLPEAMPDPTGVVAAIFRY
jgi:hypothetical protein